MEIIEILIFICLAIIIVIMIVRTYLRSKKEAREVDTFAKAKQIFAELDQLKQTLVDERESEKNKLALDFHDDVIGKLTATSIKMTISENPSKEVIDGWSKEINLAIASIREIIFDLSHKSMLGDDFGHLVKDLLQKNEGRGIEIDYRTNNQMFTFTVSQKQTIYRIIQELLNNTFTHSQASLIKVNLNWSYSKFILYYSDNGIGLSKANVKKDSLGMSGIKLRTDMIQAKYEFGSPKQGMEFYLTLKNEF